MRSTVDIICAVTDCKPVELEECKMALIALSKINFYILRKLYRLAKAILSDRPTDLLKFLATEANKDLELMQQAMKKDPLVWLGSTHTPGTPEQIESQKLAVKIFKAATGIDLDNSKK